MKTIAFFGLGNMGRGMALNLLKAGYRVNVYDLLKANMDEAAAHGAVACETPEQAVVKADFIVSMLPAGTHVHSLYFGDDAGAGIVEYADKSAVFIDCSTIEADMARTLGSKLQQAGFSFCDAPVSGGVAGAAMGTLTFIVGGKSQHVKAITPVLEAMGQNIFHAGDVGAGQIAKICNNMLLSVLMAGTSEALQLAIDNGLDPSVMSQIMSKSSGNNWTLEKYNPCPGVMPNVPSSNNYEGGFMVSLMNKDLGLAMQTASLTDSKTPMGELAQLLYKAHQAQGNETRDFSSIFEMYANKKVP